MTRAELFKKVGVKDEAEFYERYPDEQSFSSAHPDIPVMGLGGILKGIGNVAKAVLPTALSFIPGVGGIASQAAGALLGGQEGGQNGGQKKGLFGKILGAGMNILGGVMNSGVLNSKDGVPGQLPMIANQGAQMINNAQMNNQARDQFLSGLMPNSRALMNQFGSDDQPILYKYGGGTVEDADIVPQRFRSSGQVNAEVEEGEVVEDQEGNIEYVNPNDPHAGKHGAEGGALMVDAYRVLEDTSNKRGRNSWKDKTLRLSPEEAEKVTGIKFKKSTSHAGALMKADQAYGEKRAKYTKAIDKVNKMRHPDKLAMSSAQLNLKMGMKLPTKEVLFDKLYDHQEEVKYATGIDSGEKMQYGGIRMAQFGSEWPPKNKAEMERLKKMFFQTTPAPVDPKVPGVTPPPYNPMLQITNETLRKAPLGTGSNRTAWDKIQGNFQYPGEVRDVIPGYKPPSAAPVVPAKSTASGSGSVKKNTAHVQPIKISIPGDLSAGEETQMLKEPKTFGSMISDSVTQIQNNLGGIRGGSRPMNEPVTGSSSAVTATQRRSAGYVPEKMDALDYKPLVDALTLRKAPVRFTPIDLERMKLKRISARPMVDQINSDFRSALATTNGDTGAVSSLLARKYEATNQALGNVQNANNQIFNQEEMGNTEISNKESLLKNQNLDQFDAKIATRNANYDSVRNEMMNSFYSNVRANRQFNRNAKMMLEFAGRGMYDQEGQFIPGSGYGSLAGGSLPQEPGKTTQTTINRGWDVDGRRVVTGTTRTKKKLGGKIKFK